jgi:hypothetical protein
MTEEKKLFDTGHWYKNDRKNFLWRFVNTDTDTRHAANEGRSGLGPNRPRQRSSRRPNDRPSDPRGGNIIKLFFFAENKLECIWLPSFSKLQYLGLRTGAYSETLDSRKKYFPEKHSILLTIKRSCNLDIRSQCYKLFSLLLMHLKNTLKCLLLICLVNQIFRNKTGACSNEAPCSGPPYR